MHAGIEAGGTKFVVAIGSGPDDVVARTTVPTTTPGETLDRVAGWIGGQRAHHPVDALGVASFGPVDLRRGSPTYGHITTTPKPGWAGTDVIGRLRQRLGGSGPVPIGFDTDVNGAALAEHRWGAGAGLASLVYVTVGTGIGGGAVVAGRPLHGLVHTEMGHLPVPRHPDDGYAGGCPFHGDCLEGLAAGPTVAARFGRRGEDLGRDAPAAVALLSFYLARMVAAVTYVLSPERVVLGGGVMQLPGLLTAVRRATGTVLAGALDVPRLTTDLDDYVVAPRLGPLAGVLGALALADDAARAAGA